METKKLSRCSIGAELESTKQYYDDSHKNLISKGQYGTPSTFACLEHYFNAQSELAEHDKTCEQCAEAIK